MNETSDVLDVVIGLLAAIFMFTICVWSLDITETGYANQVEERTSVHNVYGQAAVPTEYTAEDCILTLVTADQFAPDPASIVFQYGNQYYNVAFNSLYFNDINASVNKAWSEFFYNKMDTKVESWELDDSGNRWVVKLVN